MRDLAPKREIIVVPDRRALAETAARRLIARIAANPLRPAVCLTGGSTPQQLYELLATSPWREQIPWARVHWFMGDDRFVPYDDPLSNIGIARKRFLDDCAPAGNIHPIPINCATPDEAAEAYERKLRTVHPLPLDEGSPLFDIVLMGVGPDGHTASLFPETSALREQRKWVIGVPYANVAPFVPRVSLTLPCLASTREMLFLVSGRDKKNILTRVLAGGELPAARAQSAHGEAIWLLDEAAAPNGGIMQTRDRLSAVIVMGVSGSGKTTVAEALARQLGFDCEDGDSYHPKSNVAKMHAGIPLTDDDRWPWLQAIVEAIDRDAAARTPVVIACSALKRAYRAILVHGRDDVRIVYLKGSRELIEGRLALRTSHFMPTSLLGSQFATIEEPLPAEHIITVNIDATVDEIVAQIIERLHVPPEVSKQ